MWKVVIALKVMILADSFSSILPGKVLWETLSASV